MTEQSTSRDRTLPPDDRHVLLDDDPFQGVAAPGKQPTLTTGGQPAFFSCWDVQAYYGENYIVQGVSFDGDVRDYVSVGKGVLPVVMQQPRAGAPRCHSVL